MREGTSQGSSAMVATHGAAYARARLHADLQHADEAVASSQGRVTRNWKIFWCLRENVIGVGGVLFEEASLRRPADFVRLRLHIARYSQKLASLPGVALDASAGLDDLISESSRS